MQLITTPMHALKNVCIPVMGATISEFLNNLENIQTQADFIELRADYIKDFSIENLQQIKDKTTKKSIFVLRKLKDGGHFKGEVEIWKEIMDVAVTLGFDYIDLELGTNQLVDLSKLHPQTKIILSYHHFYETPGYRKLRNLQKRMRGYKPFMMKFATSVKSNDDLKTLIRLLVSSKNADKMIVLGMGAKGKLSRIIFPLLGSQITFATLENSTESAPGQLSLQQTTEIMKYLDSNGLIDERVYAN
jgi:3-dehydroquinate dehydratase type I